MNARLRWEESVRAVDWEAFDYPNDPGRIQPLLLQLWEPVDDPAEKAATYSEIRALIIHQGATFESSIAVARLLVDFVGEPDAPDLDLTCLTLQRIALGDEGAALLQEPDIETRRHELARKIYLLQHPEDDIGSERWDADLVEGVQTFMQAYDAVREGVPAYIRLLDAGDPDAQLRACALLGCFPENREQSVPSIIALMRQSSNGWVRSTAAVALGMVSERDDPTNAKLLTRVLSSGFEVERWSAAIGLAKMLTAPSGNVVTELFDCLWETYDEAYPWGYLEGHIGDFASGVIVELPRSTASVQVNLLLPRLQTPSPLDHRTVIQMLLMAALGDKARRPYSLDVSQLPLDQAGALNAIAELILSNLEVRTRRVLNVLQAFHIPASDFDNFVNWATGKRSS